MPYRTSDDPNAQGVEEARALARDLHDLTRAAVKRRRNAALGVSAAIAVAVVTLFVGPALEGRRQQLKCHRIELRWENAKEIPGQTWTDCRWR
jgi:hypothetical protein